MENVKLVHAIQSAFGRSSKESDSMFHYSDEDVSGVLALIETMEMFRNIARKTLNAKITAYAITPRDYTYPPNWVKLKFSKTVIEHSPIRHYTLNDEERANILHTWENGDSDLAQNWYFSRVISQDFIKEKMTPVIEKAWEKSGKERDFYMTLIGYCMPLDIMDIGGMDIGSVTPNDMFHLIYTDFSAIKTLKRRLALAEGMKEGVSLDARDHDLVESLYTMKMLFAGPVLKELFYD